MLKLILVTLSALVIGAPAYGAGYNRQGGGFRGAPVVRSAPAFRGSAFRQQVFRAPGVRYGSGYRPNFAPRPSQIPYYGHGYRPNYPYYNRGYGYRYPGYGYGGAAVVGYGAGYGSANYNSTVNENSFNFAPSVNVQPYVNQYNPYVADQQPVVPVEPAPEAEVLPEEAELPPPPLAQDPAAIKKQRIINTINRLILELRNY